MSSPRSTIEIWVRHVGSRRQAFYREAGTQTCGWRVMSVPAADKALRRGTITIGSMVDAPVVPRETEEEVARRERFAETASHIKGVMDSMAAGSVSRETQGASA